MFPVFSSSWKSKLLALQNSRPGFTITQFRDFYPGTTLYIDVVQAVCETISAYLPEMDSFLLHPNDLLTEDLGIGEEDVEDIYTTVFRQLKLPTPPLEKQKQFLLENQGQPNSVGLLMLFAQHFREQEWEMYPPSNNKKISPTIQPSTHKPTLQGKPRKPWPYYPTAFALRYWHFY